MIRWLPPLALGITLTIPAVWLSLLLCGLGVVWLCCVVGSVVLQVVTVVVICAVRACDVSPNV